VIGKVLNTERSTLTFPGPLIVFRPTLPNCPGNGLVKAAGLNHCCRVRPPDGSSETPGTAFGRASPPVFEKSVRAWIVNGVPVVKESIPINSQPLTRNFASPLVFSPKGN